MGKKKRKAKADNRGNPVAARPAALPERSSLTPPGQRYYEMPYSAATPRLINPDLGLHHLVARAGHNAAYEISVTLLDAPDHRLIRSGVLLAHRVLDGRGEWYITAPDWQPLLPTDRIELMGHADLPEELADMIRPLRRRATLGPVAALTCDRREFALRDDEGTTLALLRDDKVTVRRGGLTTARYREVLITPVGPGLNDEQAGWLDRSLAQVGATQVPRFPAAGFPPRRSCDRADRPTCARPVRCGRALQEVRLAVGRAAAAPDRGSRSRYPWRRSHRRRPARRSGSAAEGGTQGTLGRTGPRLGRGSLRRAWLDQPGSKITQRRGA